MIIVLASIRVKPGKRTSFLEIFNRNVPEVLAEKGCIEYAPAVDFPSGFPNQALDENVVTIVEKWESLDSLKDHLASAHMNEYREKVNDLTEGMDLKVLEPK